MNMFKPRLVDAPMFTADSRPYMYPDMVAQPVDIVITAVEHR